MADPVTLSHFLHGLAAGAVLVTGVAIFRSGLGRNVRWAGLLFGLSVACWLFVETPGLSAAAGDIRALMAIDFTAAGFFWLFLLTIFADARITPLTLAPAALLAVSGVVQVAMAGPVSDGLWVVRNLFAAGLAAHAGAVVARGWRDDLVEGRRRFRGAFLTAACAYSVLNIAAGFASHFDPQGPWLSFVVGRIWGGVMVASLTVAFGLMALQPRPSVFGVVRRGEPAPDIRAEAVDRALLARLQALMAAEGWRREGLTIGGLAAELEVSEHRLRRLINQRLGHRNFADYVNGHRIEAAKARLADPAQARITVAEIAFDLGFGSIGPFNRAFRAVAGATPTEWRRAALQAAWPELEKTG